MIQLESLLPDEDIQKKSAIEKIKYRLRPVDTIQYLNNINYLSVSKEGELENKNLINNQNKSAIVWKNIAEKIRSNKRMNKVFLSDDEKSTAIYLILNIDSKDANSMNDFFKATDKVLDPYKAKYNIKMAGSPIITNEVGESVKMDNITFVPLIFSIIFLILVILNHRVGDIVLPLIVCIVTTLWTIALMGVFGITINIITVVTPIFLATIAIVDSIHYLAKYNQLVKQGETTVQAIMNSYKVLFKPLALTSITTFFGILSLSYSEIPFIKEFAIFCSIGILLAFFLTLTILPALLSRFDVWSISVIKINRPLQNLDANFINIYNYIKNKKVSFLILITFLISTSMYQITKVEVNFSNYEGLKKDSKVVRDNHFISEHFSGSVPASLLMESPESDQFYDGKILEKIYLIQQQIEKYDEIKLTFSIVDLIREINDSGFNSKPLLHYPDLSGEEIFEMLSILESDSNDSLYSLLNEDGNATRILIVANTDEGKFWYSMSNDIESFAQNQFTSIGISNIDVEMIAYGNIMRNLIIQVIDGQIISLILSVSLIAFVITILLKSIILGIIALLPIFLTLLINFALMGTFNLVLDISTSLIISVVFGIGIDYSIHFLESIKRNANQIQFDLHETIVKSLEDVSVPVALNSLIIALGIISLLASSFEPIRNLGILTASSLVICAIVALVVLPVVIHLLGPHFIHQLIFKGESVYTHSKSQTSISQSDSNSL